MKAITIRQPWADAVVEGAKTVENRLRGFPHRHRGLVLVHAAQLWADDPCVFTDERLLALWPDGSPFQRTRGYALRHVPAYRGRPPSPFVSGAFVGAVEVVDVHPETGCCAPWGEASFVAGGRTRRQVVHLVLEAAQRLPAPIPARGALGLWTPRGEDAKAALGQLEAA